VTHFLEPFPENLNLGILKESANTADRISLEINEYLYNNNKSAYLVTHIYIEFLFSYIELSIRYLSANSFSIYKILISEFSGGRIIKEFDLKV